MLPLVITGTGKKTSVIHKGYIMAVGVENSDFEVKAKYSRLRLFNLGGMSCFNHNAQFNEFEYHFACRRKVVHLCFITSPGKMIFAVLEL